VHKHLIPGSAEIDFAAIWDALRSVDYAGYVSVELFDHDADPHAAAVESLRFLSNLSRRASTLSAQESEVGG
jgi:sugar phosphate isomerase/epimerase